MNKTCGIYMIECKANGKKYIGQALDIGKRFKQHELVLSKNKHSNIYLQRAWNKYGKEQFEFRILERDIDPIDLNQREIELIFEYETFLDMNKGYNLTIGGDSGKRSEETKRRMSLAQQNMSEETKEKIRLASIGNKNSVGFKQSEETKLKKSLATIGRIGTRLGKKNSEGHKEKIRLAAKKQWVDFYSKTVG